jgi:predicted metal-dependent enzyme (double-stranded beta helix superfamily)
MTYTNLKGQRPLCLKVTTPVEKANLIVKGQGVVVFDASGPCCLTFCDASGSPGLKVQFTATSVLVNLQPSNEPLLDSKNTKGLVTQRGAYYWFSLDAQNQRLFAGIGEVRKETAIYTFQDGANSLSKKFLESLVSVRCENLQLRELLRDPITRSIPLLVKDKEGLTMHSLASGTYIPKANLSLTAQKLHDCIAGKHFVLNTPDFPQFVAAIEHSIATPGKWCYERLKQKATEFDKDHPNDKETYLRITLGENNGESPGIPYVMEIWPVGHFSPIHNHGNSTAIIRVLNGTINVSLFPFLSGDALEPFAKADFTKGDITWISPSLNQVHQLKNLDGNKDTCITIQCYMYDVDDKKHYDYFDYLNETAHIQQFEPDSDMDFLDFKAVIQREWLESRPKRSWFC